MNKKFNLLIIIFIFLVLPLISAPSPFISATSSGCEIAPVYRDYITQNNDFDFNFHVINASNGYPMSNTTISCYFHLYNQSGDHSLSLVLKNDPITEHDVINEFVARVSGNNFSNIGEYAYIVQCNGSQLYGGCLDKGGFIVNPSGTPSTVAQTVIYSLSLIFILIILAFTIWGAIIMPWGNQVNEETKAITINDFKYFKIVLWIFVYLEFLFLIGLLRNITLDTLMVNGFYSFFNIFYTVLLIGLLPMFPLLIFFTIITYLTDKKTIKNLSRGLPA